VALKSNVRGRAKVGRFPAAWGRLQPAQSHSEVAGFRFLSLSEGDWLVLI